MSEDFKQAALDYHQFHKPGKISVELTTPAQTSRDLSLAYSPGVAEPVKEIAADPENAYKYTAKGNLVAVITDGTAILGLGNLGPLASKPVMEGKSLLFKRFAGVDSIDIEVESESPQAFIDTVRRIAITFGGINLEDIKAPECFEIERTLIEQCSIPVFHDDQHGTAIVTVAGMINALEIQGKKIEDATMTVLGAGAAAISSVTAGAEAGSAAGMTAVVGGSADPDDAAIASGDCSVLAVSPFLSERSGVCVAGAFFDSGQKTTTSSPCEFVKERLILANSSSGLRLFICSFTRRRASMAYAVYSSNCSSEGVPSG